MGNRIHNDFTGRKINHLTVLEYAGSDGGISKWKCRCDCGNIVYVRGSRLKNGEAKACGCLMKNGWGNGKTHGLSKSRIFKSWQNMKSRCNNPHNTYYKDYGGRGITFCDEWLAFENFYNWAMANGYSDELTLDRIDTNGNYEPGNCRWADRKEQANNTRRNHYIEWNGERRTIAEWGRVLNVSYNSIYLRLYRHNWDMKTALSLK